MGPEPLVPSRNRGCTTIRNKRKQKMVQKERRRPLREHRRGTPLIISKGIVDIMVQCPETEQEVRWRFLALYCPSCPVNLISLSAIGTGKLQELKLRNSREGWNGEFTISSPDGKTHRMCAKEHPHMRGSVCVEVRMKQKRTRSRERIRREEFVS